MFFSTSLKYLYNKNVNVFHIFLKSHAIQNFSSTTFCGCLFILTETELRSTPKNFIRKQVNKIISQTMFYIAVYACVVAIRCTCTLSWTRCHLLKYCLNTERIHKIYPYRTTRNIVFLSYFYFQ